MAEKCKHCGRDIGTWYDNVWRHLNTRRAACSTAGTGKPAGLMASPHGVECTIDCSAHEPGLRLIRDAN